MTDRVLKSLFAAAFMGAVVALSLLWTQNGIHVSGVFALLCPQPAMNAAAAASASSCSIHSLAANRDWIAWMVFGLFTGGRLHQFNWLDRQCLVFSGRIGVSRCFLSAVLRQTFSLGGFGVSDNLSNLLIGVLFGASLDLAGFGSPRTLNGQFQLRDFSMFKVMFGAIVVAASAYLLLLGMGLAPVQRSVIPSLDLAVLLGGFLLGVGLVLGGYCPGTALTGAAGGRLDAWLFFLMMYPGYRLWVWLEPQWQLNFHVLLLPKNMTLHELLGISPLWILAALALACWLGWRLGNYFEAESRGERH